MRRLVLESWFHLLYVDFLLRFRGFAGLHRVVAKHSVRRPRDGEFAITSRIVCEALDLACVFYFKQVLCLQHSAATTLVLRRHGWEAELVIGAQIAPPKWHAWVELQGIVVNDKPYMRDIFHVLNRCSCEVSQ
jgi:hypothetical protein